MKKYWKTIVQVEVLSEDVPPEFDTLAELHTMITTGDCSGDYEVQVPEELTEEEMEEALVKQGSDIEFFGIE